MRVPAALSLLALICAPLAHAVPGPDTTAVIANLNVPESVALADMYRRLRGLPASQVCLLDLPEVVDLPLAAMLSELIDPLESCLAPSGALERLEALVLMRGVPLRVVIPTASGDQRASLAAALGTWDSTLPDGRALLGQPPGQMGNCGGTPCLAAAWPNLYRQGSFEPGWTMSNARLIHRPVLVTMLHGRSYTDAARLLTSALDAEAQGGARGRFVFMNGADAARGVLDNSYPGVINGLMRRGFTDAEQLPFDAERTGLQLAAFFVGTAALGSTIEGNQFLPGALVDNLTSFGAVPENFEASGESQVSIARWVAQGVAGVHGTTDEPLNNCFPSRELVLAWVDGFTLAESYLRSMPFIYWHNLVLGDAMAAPYAQRPRVSIEGVSAGETVEGSRALRVSAEDPQGLRLASLKLYVDGVERAASGGEPIEGCFAVPEAEHVHLLAVAQSAEGPRSKGWSAFELRGTRGSTVCASPPDAGVGLDAAAADAATSADAAPLPDAGAELPVPPAEGGCACSSGGGPGDASLLILGTVVLLGRRRWRSPGTC